MERTRISYIAVPDEVTYAAFRKERRMRFANAVKPIQFFFDFSALVVSHKGVAWIGNPFIRERLGSSFRFRLASCSQGHQKAIPPRAAAG